jgi:hypothetical protein
LIEGFGQETRRHLQRNQRRWFGSPRLFDFDFLPLVTDVYPVPLPHLQQWAELWIAGEAICTIYAALMSKISAAATYEGSHESCDQQSPGLKLYQIAK